MAGNYETFTPVERSERRTGLDWQDDALCAQTSPDLFTPEEARYADAKKICAKCDVGLQCLLHALETGEGDGMYGGMSPRQRRKLLDKTRDEIALAYEANLKRIKRL